MARKAKVDTSAPQHGPADDVAEDGQPNADMAAVPVEAAQAAGPEAGADDSAASAGGAVTLSDEERDAAQAAAHGIAPAAPTEEHLLGFTELAQPAIVTARVARRRIGRQWLPGDHAIIDLDALTPAQVEQLLDDEGFDVSFDFD